MAKRTTSGNQRRVIQQRARSTALAELRRRHVEEFTAIYDQTVKALYAASKPVVSASLDDVPDWAVPPCDHDDFHSGCRYCEVLEDRYADFNPWEDIW